MKQIMICGPFSAKTTFGVEQNVMEAKKLAARLWKLGRFAVICPHSNTGATFNGLAPEQVFIDGDLEFLRRSDAGVFMTTWKDSPGACNEHKFAGEHDKKIFYDSDTLEEELIAWDEAE